MVSCRVHPGVIIPLGFSASEVPRRSTNAGCHHKEVVCRRERARAGNLACARHTVVLDVVSVRSALWKLSNYFLGFLKRMRGFLRAVVPLSGCRAPRPDGDSRLAAPLALALASLVSIPFLFFEEKRKKKTRSPSCLFLLLLPLFLFSSFSSLLPSTFPPKLSRRPGAPSRRRRPSLANYGRRRRDGTPGPLVSSRAEAEAVFRLPSFLFISAEGRPRPDEESDRAREPGQCSF